jgi:protein O-mannosyl-transferase
MSKRKQSERRRTTLFQNDDELAPDRNHVLAGSILIIGLILLAYWPSIHGGFIMDDDILLTNNATIRAPDGLYRIWFTKEPLDYWPVSNSCLWLQWRLWGMNPTGYHVVNVLLHSANCLLIWLLLKRLAIPGAYFATLLFAFHPVNVESVAWISQLKTILPLFFFLISILCYLNVQRAFNRWYFASIIAFVFAMLGKSSVAIFPLVLLLVVWWQNQRLTMRDVWQVVPFLLIAMVLILINIWIQTRGAHITVRTATGAQRLAGAASALWFYLFKAIAPLNLSFVYPQWNIDTSNFLWWLPLAAAITVSAVLCYFCFSAKKPWARCLLFVWLYFGFALLPALGFIDVGYMKYSLVADHYQYIALIGVVTLFAGGGVYLQHRIAQPTNFALNAAGVFLVAALMYLTWQQNHLYADCLTLYQAAEQQNPKSVLVETNLSVALANLDRVSESLSHAQQAVDIDPNFPDARCALGIAFSKSGQTNQAIQEYRKALDLDPTFAKVASNLGAALARKGQLAEALPYLQRAVELNPFYFDARSNFGRALTAAGHLPEALEQLEAAVQLHPDYVEGEINMGEIEHGLNHNLEALTHFQLALRIEPNFPEAYVRIALVSAEMNRPADAIAAAQKAIDLARAKDDFELAQQAQAWLTNYRAEQTDRTHHDH